VFTRERRSSEDGRLREALSFSLDRSSMRNAASGEGEVAGGILPGWLSGYDSVSGKTDLTRAQQLKSGVKTTSWTLGYNSNDPLGRLLAERIALNARDSGIAIQVTSSSDADLRLLRIPLVSLDPPLALRSAVSPPAHRYLRLRKCR
jgi:ABC-type transport system substrate-binding protein